MKHKCNVNKATAKTKQHSYTKPKWIRARKKEGIEIETKQLYMTMSQ